jgi:predicted acylesterase/phospholipase RssA
MNTPITSFFILCLIFNSYTSTVHATEQPRRISIAISGGTSKGAYEAGLNWGLIKLMREAHKIDATLIGQINSMEAASFSGASAGGINTLLSGLGWCSLSEAEGGLSNSINSNIFRDVWLTPDVNRLLPPTPDSKYYSSTDAILSRYDLNQTSTELLKHWNEPKFRSGCRIPLGVTVTRVIPDQLKVGSIEVQNQRMFIPFEVRTQKDKTLGFYFNPVDYPTMSDPAMILMPRLYNMPNYSIEDQRIQDAILTSAAFPGAFGRKRLQYCRLNNYSVVNKEMSESKTKQQKSDIKLVCPYGYELTEAEFADGGLFDNLPIGLARKLAEQHKHANENVLPVTYIYIDPDRLRYKVPQPANTRACASDNPPKACKIMEFSFFTEEALLLDALGTARKYELYRELTSEHWSLNLVQLSYELAEKIRTNDIQIDCQKDIPFFRTKLSCAGAIDRAGALLELSYYRKSLPITSPYSAEKLTMAGIVNHCDYSKNNPNIGSQAECQIDEILYRNRLANILLNIVGNNKQFIKEYKDKINKAKLSMHNDRILRVSNRGAPITGTLLSDFGAFLDLKFREYDYYVGVYDAIITATKTLCGLNFSEKYQKQKFNQCQNVFFKSFYDLIGVDKDPRARYLFARLAKWEFSKENTLHFAYTPMPEEDRDMRIIFDGLMKTLESGEKSDAAKKGLFFTENTFFQHLKNENFLPTATDDGTVPLLTQIINDPSQWSSELTRRITTRIVYLEQQAEAIYTAREPEPDKRASSYTTLMGITAYALQTATYKYPDFTFAPSTAPDNWAWRNFIPYEVAIDIAESDMLFTWQPTWALSNQNLIAVRASLGFAGGLIESSESKQRENYGAMGLNYTRQNNLTTFSSWGLTPTWYHQWNKPVFGKQDTFGGDIHLSFFKDRLRVGLGARDFGNTADTWFLTFGLTDLPGLTYWLTR